MLIIHRQLNSNMKSYKINQIIYKIFHQYLIFFLEKNRQYLDAMISDKRLPWRNKFSIFPKRAIKCIFLSLWDDFLMLYIKIFSWWLVIKKKHDHWIYQLMTSSFLYICVFLGIKYILNLSWLNIRIIFTAIVKAIYVLFTKITSHY